MLQQKTNVVLIGMPGAGKSTVGVILAKNLGMDFIDTDLLIQSVEKRTLQDILDSEGYMVLRDVEERVLLTLGLSRHVIATGGSAAYSRKAMEHLKGDGIVFFLHLGFEALLKRIHNFDTRGIAKSPNQTFEELFHERFLLYSKYADHTIDCSGHDQEEVAEAIGKLFSPTSNNKRVGSV